MTFLKSQLSLPLLLGVSTVAAQIVPPPLSTHTDPVHLEHLVVSASPLPRSQAELLSTTTVLTGRALQLRQQPTLGETLASEVGISSTAFGPGASRPIIRGLGGDRIRILENGVGTIDASVVSPDHAISVEPFLVERIEVVRGPASLLYGSSAIGGVVNVITHRIEQEAPESLVEATLEARYGSASDETGFGGVANLALLRTKPLSIVLHVDGFRRTTNDLEIPGFAESAAERARETAEALEHGEEPPEFIEGTLPNSSVESEGGAVGLSFIGERFWAGVSYQGFDTLYGVPGHSHGHASHESEEESSMEAPAEGEAEEESEEESVQIDLRQRRTDFQAGWRNPDAASALKEIRLKAGVADYRHQELEGEEIGTTFTNEGYDSRLEVLHGPVGPLEGMLGAQFAHSDFSAIGEEAFLPASETTNRALFLFEEIRQGSLTWQFGARYEHQEIEVSSLPAKRTDDAFSGSAGLVWAWAEPYAVALSLTRTERPPNAQELYADGPHIGTRQYEVGDSNLDTEESTGVEVSLRRRAGWITGSATVFLNQFDGYIFDRPTGEEEDDLPVYRFVQRDATFWGVELEGLVHLHETTAHQLDLELAGDLTQAEEDDGAYLPRIPPMKGKVGLRWTHAAYSLGLEYLRVASQDKVAPNETTTDGYGRWNAHVTYRLPLGRAYADWFLRVTNLSNEEARVHTSFLKDLAPLSARSAHVGVRLTF